MNGSVKLMIDKAKHSLKNSYAPYSNYAVSCCIRSGEDFFTGINIENSSFSLTVCAETAAIAQMITSGKQTIDQLVLMAGNDELCTPCGGCRQRIFEFSTPETQIYLCNKTSVLKILTIDELLPLAFRL